MNCALIDDDDDDGDNGDVAVVDCAVDADGIVSAGMHEKKRGKKTRTAEKGHDAALWSADDGGRRGKRRTGQ
jgi:hypothetical protein